MKVLYEKSFFRDLKKVNDRNTLDKIYNIIENIKSSDTIQKVPNIKRLKGHPFAFRIRIGDYRLGFFYENDTVIFVRFLNRKEIYSKFP